MLLTSSASDLASSQKVVGVAVLLVGGEDVVAGLGGVEVCADRVQIGLEQTRV